MDANELRIGNLLEVDGNFWKVSAIITNPFELYFEENEEYDHAGNAKPIPLTEEWLFRMGFKKEVKEEDFYAQWYFLNEYSIYFEDSAIKKPLVLFCIDYRLDDNITFKHRINHVKYVHQIQNLIFVLTAEELQLK